MTRSPEEATAFRDRAKYLATEALHGAMLDDRPRVEAAAKALNEELGGGGIVFALTAWCDTLIVRQQELAGSDDTAVVRPVWLDLDSGELALDADDVPEEIRWAGRLVAARMALDKPAWGALISAIPKRPMATGQYVSALLSCVAETLGTLNRMEQRRRP